MVCDGAMIASTALSLMMNGVCCVWQMQEEDDKRAAIRKDIRIEYERQRLLDLERFAGHSIATRQYESDSSLEDDRRKSLLNSKSEVTARRRNLDREVRDSASISGTSALSVAAVLLPVDRSPMVSKQVDRASFSRSKRERLYCKRQRRPEYSKRSSPACADSSLFDFDDDDIPSDEEVLSLVDVALD